MIIKNGCLVYLAFAKRFSKFCDYSNKALIFAILDVIKEATSGFSPIAASFIFLHISSQVTTSSACGSSWWYSVNSGLSAAGISAAV